MAGNPGSAPFVAQAEAMAKGKVPLNADWLKHAASRCPRESIFHSLLGREHFFAGRYDESRTCLEEAVRRETNPVEKSRLEAELCETVAHC